MRVAVVRGSYLNPFEMDSYARIPHVQLTGFSSLNSFHGEYPFEVKRLWSPADIPSCAGPVKPLVEKIVKFTANRTLGDAQLLYNLEKEIRDYDIVHTADPHYFYSYQLARIREKGLIKRLVATSWETIPFNNESTSAKRRIKRYSLSKIDHFVCYADRAKEALVIEGVPAQRITVIPLGVDIERFNPDPSIRRKDNITRLLFVGRMVPEKGVWDIYEAFRALIKTSKKKYTLTFCGEGSEKKYMETSVRNNGLTDLVRFTSLPYAQLHTLYQAADILLMSSRKTATWEEQYGMVAVEALASGLLVVAYSTGSLPEIIGNAGILCNEGDIQCVWKGIQSLTDTEMVDYQKKARERAVDRYNAKKTAGKLRNLYEKLIQND